jgi:poly(ribitol-phosphate) beta-N-acetylglucosaminyltransferase
MERLRAAERLIESTAALLPPGEQRDAVLRRHFDWELSKLLGKEFAGFDRETQEAVCACVKELSAAYLTGRIRERLSPMRRYRLALAARGHIDLLGEPGLHTASPPLVLDDERVLQRLPGFGELDEDCFVFEGAFDRRIAGDIRVIEATYTPDRFLVLRIRAPILGYGAAEPAAMSISGVPAEVSTELAVDRSGTTLCARIPVRMLLRERRHSIKLAVTAAGVQYEFPLPAPARRLRHRRWHLGRPYRISLAPGRDDQMVVCVSRIPWRRALLGRKV